MAFAHFYISSLNYARATGDLSGLVPLEDDECLTCQSLRHAIAQVYDNGGTITGGSWRVQNLGAASPGPKWTVDGHVEVTRQRVRGTARDDGVTAADIVTVNGTLVRRDGAWKVLSWVRGV